MILSFHGLLKPLYAKSAFQQLKIKWIILKGDLITPVIKNFFAFYPHPENFFLYKWP